MAATLVSMFLLFLLPFAAALITNASEGQYHSSLDYHDGWQPTRGQAVGQPYYQYLQFVVQNPKSLDPCSPVRSYFTIHGLWPYNISNNKHHDVVSIENCSYCPPRPHQYWLPTNLENSLDIVWPDAHSVRPNHQRFRENEYKKHGSCTNRIFPRPEDYFEKALHWYDLIIERLLDHHHRKLYPNIQHLVSQPGNRVRTGLLLNDVRQAIKDERRITAEPLLLCNGGKGQPQQLKEIVICLNQHATEATDCTKRRGLCRGGIYLQP